MAYTRPGDPKKNDLLKLGTNAARTILFPRHWFFLKPPGTPVLDAPKTLEDITTSLRRSDWLGRLTAYVSNKSSELPRLPGYVNKMNQFYEAQVFTFISAIGFIVLFWVLYPLTAPRPTAWSRLAFAVILVSLLLVLRVFFSGRCEDKRLLRRWQAFLSGGAVGFCAVIPLVYCLTDPERFPTLAAVLLLMIVLGWTFAGFAFFLDRFRIPVLTLFILFALVPRIFHWYGSSEEHYVSTTPLRLDDAELKLSTPAQILGAKLKADADAGEEDSHPFIIVTATGGGLHASAWTARVLKQLNDEMASETESFRKHIVLLSTVSGASTGLSYYLREIDPATSGGSPDFNRMVIASQCSSLEAVGWGLVYYDVPKAIVPLAPVVLRSSSDDDDLESSPSSRTVPGRSVAGSPEMPMTATAFPPVGKTRHLTSKGHPQNRRCHGIGVCASGVYGLPGRADQRNLHWLISRTLLFSRPSP
ncbi:hypothetical protein [Tunturiibacter gelidiferens]|uniref:hypothetical protein n=1 Tax=Tunturiibacter gelidiferens TaxID=3069689 RepID=UPI003D9BF5D7